MAQYMQRLYNMSFISESIRQKTQTLVLNPFSPQKGNLTFFLNNKEYLCFEGLDLHFAASSGIDQDRPGTELHGLIVTNYLISHIGIKDGAATYGISSWHSDENSLYPQAPLFVDLENNDFRLQVESPAIDAGTNMGLAFEGLAPDIGAFEYGL